MILKHLMLSLSGAALVAGCASEVPAPQAPPPPRTMASFLNEAEAAVKLGKSENAIAVLKVATRMYPADKAPWLRIAQVSFECQEYGESISYAKKVLERDPDDIVAHSIVAVSGLRVSSKALADLASKKRVTGDVRDAAQDLAKILRSSIGGEIIPAPVRARISIPRAPAQASNMPVVKTPTQSLIDALNQPNDSGRK